MFIEEPTHAWRSASLGAPRELALPEGRLRYHDRGDGPPIVFAHGWLANANLWRKVVVALEPRFRCIVLDLPLGAHAIPMNVDADLSPDGCGGLVARAIEALDLDDVTLVGNDSGGAYSQIAVASSPARVARLVLNACETPFDPFPPAAFSHLTQAAATPAALRRLLEPLRERAVRRSPLAFGHLAKRPIDDDASDSYSLPCLVDDGILRDASKVMRAASQTFVQRAAERLAELDTPVLFAWASEDKFFPLENARRYAAMLQRARVELVEDTYSFTPEDQPVRLADLIARFIERGT